MMRRRSPIIALALATFVLMYALMLAGTFNGILAPELNMFTMTMLTLGGTVWLVSRWRLHWANDRNPLDTVVILWLAVTLISLASNPESARRIFIGIWFMLLYIGIWYALYDLIAHRVMDRSTLIDALLIIGIVMIFFGYFQFFNLQPVWVRPVSLLGNPNLLAAFLIMLIPFTLERAWVRRGVIRWAMSTYSLSGIILLLLTFSRGGWIGLGAGIAARLLLAAYEQRLHTREGRAAFLTRTPRALLITAAAAGVITLIAGVGVIAWSLNLGGRSLDYRAFVYETAISLIRQHPLAGTGLFTFGEGLARLNSMPPTQPHSHAHNLILNVAAELGLPGLAVFLFTLWAIWKTLRASLTTVRGKTTFHAGIFALAAYGAHHLTDLPSMVPAIFITMLIILAATLAPAEASPGLRRPLWRQLGLSAGFVLLLITGWFSALTYRQYMSTLDGIDVESAGVRAAQLQAVIDLDPTMPVYSQQQGYLYAVAGDYASAVSAYERYTSMIPYYSPGWANLAAAYAGAGRYDDAAAAIAQAAQLAPDMQPYYVCPLAAYRTGQLPIPSSEPDPFMEDWVFQQDFNYIQFLRISLPRLYLPQLGLPTFAQITALEGQTWVCPDAPPG